MAKKLQNKGIKYVPNRGRRNADGVAVIVFHHDAFNAVPVRKSKEIFHRAVQSGNQFFLNRRKKANRFFFQQLFILFLHILQD